jgi:class 3 adenylate cyclase/tetratricopeptide (TPR) repeat protein
MGEGARTVTVLFTDLVGSTLLSQRLEVRAADDLRRAHFSLLRREVEALGGMVVKNLGDGVMVVVDTPSAALQCAVGMQQAVERRNREASEPLRMRVGVAFGEVTESDGDFFGDAVVEAARLCALASGGQILATDVVRAVAGRRVAQELVAIGPLELKGLPGPVPCVEVRWEPARQDDAGWPLPGRLQERVAVGNFVGRAGELALLDEAFKKASVERHRQLVLVNGEAGIGKTTLAGVFARLVHAQGAAVIYGRCEADIGGPYQPWAEAIGHLVHHAPADVLDQVLADHGAELARLGPELAVLGLRGGGGSADPETARYLLFGAIVRLLAAAGAHFPILVVLDDLQWADEPTLQVLRHVMSSDEDLPLVILGAFRESEVQAQDALAELLAWSHREPMAARVSLRGLDDLELRALMEAAAGHAIDENGLALRDALSRETDGNPFFVLELLRHLIETGGLYQEASGRWTTAGDVHVRGLPVSVREVIGRRVARLGAEATRVLSAAAVIGRDFDSGLLASTSGTDRDALLDLLDAAVAATLVVNVRGECYSFTHALVGHALYDALSPARRARAHRRVAEAIEEASGPDLEPRAAELAYHWARALAPQDAEKAISYARMAGDRALAQLAPVEALRRYHQALGLLDDQRTDDLHLRAALLVGVGDAQRQSGDPTFGATLLEAGRLAQEIGDADTLVAAALANNRGLFSNIGGIDAERVRMIEAALRSIGDADTASRARLLALLAIERTWDGDYEARRELSNQAVALARRLGDPVTLRDVLLLRHNTIWVPETVAERSEITAEAEALAGRIGDPVGRFFGAIYRYVPAIQAGDFDEATRCCEGHTALAADIGQPSLRWLSAWFEGIHALLVGDADRAERLAGEAYGLGSQSGQPDAWIIFAAMISGVRSHQGRDAEIVEPLATMVASNPGIPFARAALARVYVELGQQDKARELLAAEAAMGFDLPVDPALLSGFALWAIVAARLGDVASARRLYERLNAWPDQVVFNGTVVGGSVAQVLGLLASALGDYDAAEAHFNHALAVHERLHAPYLLARTNLEWGRMLIGRARPGDRHHARAHLETALDLAQRYDCALVGQQAKSLAEQC